MALKVVIDRFGVSMDRTCNDCGHVNETVYVQGDDASRWMEEYRAMYNGQYGEGHSLYECQERVAQEYLGYNTLDHVCPALTTLYVNGFNTRERGQRYVDTGELA